MKNKLYISRHEALTEEGFLARNLGLLLGDSCECAAVPDFSTVNKPNNLSISDIQESQNKNIDTIIQYLPAEDMEYYNDYKNIAIYNPPHFITRNRSVSDKLSMFDEIWVFDKDGKIFAGENELLLNKIKIKGYPYITRDIITAFGSENFELNDNIVRFYCITNISQLENVEILIFNFISVFNRTDDVKLFIYVNDEYNSELYNQHTQQLMKKIASYCNLIEYDDKKTNVTILYGNIWNDYDNMQKLHMFGDCYINLDYRINPHVLTSCLLKKYCLSTSHIHGLVNFNETDILQTYRGSFKLKFTDTDKHYFNEYNFYPKLLDESVKDKLIKSYNDKRQHGKDYTNILNFSSEGYFHD